MSRLIKTKVSGRAVAVTVGIIIVIAASVITSLVLPKLRATSPADSDPECKSYWEQRTGTNSKTGATFQFWVPLDGYCAHGGAIVYSTDIKSCDACKSYGPDGFIAWNLKTSTTTDARAPGLEAVNGYVAGAAQARDRIIRTLNNGEKTEQELVDMFALMKAGYVNLACGVGVTSDYTGNRFTETLKYSPTDSGTSVEFMKVSADGKDVEGTVDMIQKFSIMWSRMQDRPAGSYGLCTRLPAGCSISSSYRENDYSTCADGKKTLSPHGRGQAIDIACTIPASSGGCNNGDGSNATIADKTLAKIKKYNEGFNIITECTPFERKSCGDGSLAVQVIHLDLGGGCPRATSETGGACLYSGCSFASCGSTAP